MNQNDLNFDPQNKKTVHFDSLDFDDFTIDESSFKPVTKGLGFHQETKSQQFTPKPMKATKTIGSSAVKTTALAKTIVNNFEVSKENTQKMTPNKGALAAFYGEAPATEIILDLKKEEAHEVKKFEATSLTQLCAYVLDLLMVLSFTIATLAALVAVSKIEFSILIKIISRNDQIIFGSSLFIIYYLLYFTILDMNATPGKSVFGIRLYRANGKNVSVKHTFSRALITLLSSIALTLPTFLDFQGRLSGTKVFKD